MKENKVEQASKLETLEVEIEGIRPILMRNGDMVDPENEWTKKISAIHSKKAKEITPVERERMEWFDFRGGLYWNEELGLNIPSDNIERCVVLGAQKSNLGKKVQSCVFCTEPAYKLIYKGPTDPRELYDAGLKLRKPVRIGKARIFRVRCCIPDWTLRFGLSFDNSIVSREQLMKALVDAGALLGLCDWRPKFGRFLCKWL